MGWERQMGMKKNEGIGKRYAVRRKLGGFFAAGMILAELFAALPLQAKETGEAALYEQAASLSGNDAQGLSESTQKGDSDKTVLESIDGKSSDDTVSNSSQGENPATPQVQRKPEITSQPQDVKVEAGGYASFHVSAIGKDLIYQWMVDRGDGSGFQKVKGADKELYRVMVFDGSMNGYVYKCRVTNNSQNSGGSAAENGGENSGSKNEQPYVESRAATLTIVYKIAGGARSVWVKSSGRGLIFQGSGAYSKFSGVSVDGSRITAGEYNKGGSQTPFTEITLLRSYLETLAEGEHELEISWSDGAAKTSFHIEAPASNLPDGASGLGRTGEDGTGSSRAAGTTAAAGNTAKFPGMQGKGEAASSMGSAKKAEKETAQISENTIEASVSANTLNPSSKTAADILKKTGVLADPTKEALTVTPGERRTESLPSNLKKKPVRLAAMSKAVNQYAQAICMVVILISVVGIVVGFLVYRRHDGKGKKYDS